MLCFFYLFFLHFFISFKYDFHVDAEMMKVLKHEKCKEISASMVKNNVWHDTSSVGKNCRYL